MTDYFAETMRVGTYYFFSLFGCLGRGRKRWQHFSGELPTSILMSCLFLSLPSLDTIESRAEYFPSNRHPIVH
jgi:hypothetical protein